MGVVLAALLLQVSERTGLWLLTEPPGVELDQEIFVEHLRLKQDLQEIALQELPGEVKGAHGANLCHRGEASKCLRHDQIQLAAVLVMQVTVDLA